eukprot:NODE_29866_length_434_cov_0.635179.p1 GENE.NODE_29866_length_434_cov_0.635179~~NODE_29866_length_434_cov_0.635179.p1  ORF type:complete len:66 (-),score=17.20 NODE_29866_length_434_cov_0.635179:77-274(-)
MDEAFRVGGGAEFNVAYKETSGLCEIHIMASATVLPLAALMLGFVMALWMHPGRVASVATARNFA